jgi:hypothetical protein
LPEHLIAEADRRSLVRGERPGGLPERFEERGRQEPYLADVKGAPIRGDGVDVSAIIARRRAAWRE